MAKFVVTEDNTTIVVGDGDTVKMMIPGGGTVTIKADPNDDVDKIKIEFIDDAHSDTVKLDLSTFSENDLHIDVKDYDANDEIALIGAFNKHVDPGDEDEFAFSYVGANGNTFNGFVHAKDKNEKDFTAPEMPLIICFAEGTIIDTSLGPRPVESIRVGDLVATQNNGLQAVRWVGKKRLDSIDLMLHPQMHPIRFKAGALGNGTPYIDLFLSPQHRLQIADWRTEFLFGEPQVLVAAKHLVNGTTIVVDESVATVTYYHLLFDGHEILSANGIPAESLHPGDMAMDALGTAAMMELDLLFPDLADAVQYRKTTHTVLRGFEAQAILSYAS